MNEDIGIIFSVCWFSLSATFGTIAVTLSSLGKVVEANIFGVIFLIIFFGGITLGLILGDKKPKEGEGR
jgi:hypothetical protein